MAASVQSSSDGFRLLKLVRSRPPGRLASMVPVQPYEPHAFPQADTTPGLPAIIPDAVLEHYAFTFCQGGFHALGITFEQFLLVAEAIKPRDVEDLRDDAPSL